MKEHFGRITARHRAFCRLYLKGSENLRSIKRSKLADTDLPLKNGGANMQKIQNIKNTKYNLKKYKSSENTNLHKKIENKNINFK